MQTSSGENYLFDCGSSSRSGVGRYVLLPCLKYYGIQMLDAVFVSHPDADHTNGIEELLQLAAKNRIRIGQLILPAIAPEARKEQFSGLLSAVEDYGRISAETAVLRVGWLGAGSPGAVGGHVFSVFTRKRAIRRTIKMLTRCVFMWNWKLFPCC